MTQGMSVSGKEVIVAAAEDACVQTITCVPGYPVTDVIETLEAEISVNEKVAMEIALGSSAAGRRSMVLVKQLGMNILADPLVISATHTIGSGIVVLAGDDLGPGGSQAQMDSRYFGLISDLPVMDPADPSALYHSILEAYVLSEMIKAPVIVRATSRLIETSGHSPDRRALPSHGIKFDRSIWDLTARGRGQRYLSESFPLAKDASETTSLNSLRISGNVGIIASGCPAKLAENLDVSLLVVGYAYPLPWRLIKDFLNLHDRIVIAEEPGPFLERQLGAVGKVLGRLTGHLPIGPLDILDLQRVLDSGLCMDKASAPKLGKGYERSADKGHRSICDDCPYSSLYKALGKIGVIVAGDAGCSIRAVRGPYSSVDLVYGLGSSPGVASGILGDGRKKGIAVVGDYGFIHSGIQGLINAVWKGRDILMILIQNGVAAQTGGQEVPDMTKVLEALVPVGYLDFPEDGKDIKNIEKALRDNIAAEGASAIVARGKCPRSRS